MPRAIIVTQSKAAAILSKSRKTIGEHLKQYPECRAQGGVNLGMLRRRLKKGRKRQPRPTESRETNEDTTDRSRFGTGLRFASIEGIVSEFELWWRNVKPQVEARERVFVESTAVLTRVVLKNLLELNRLARAADPTFPDPDHLP